MKMAETRKPTPEEQAALNAAADLPEDQINTTDPDAPEREDWSNAVRGALAKHGNCLRPQNWTRA